MFKVIHSEVAVLGWIGTLLTKARHVQGGKHFPQAASKAGFLSNLLEADLNHSPAAVEETFFFPISRLNKVKRLANTLRQPWWPQAEIWLIKF
ncbi:hypothetical protein [Leisingera sp. D0M16]|uniref:hypothetical protein n=1 Tax=Leisingera coralii TaxID=3351347 RepID=UPI003BA2C540